MPTDSPPNLSLFLDILYKLEDLQIPYVIIGGFAATMYGITRATYDIDIVVKLEEIHIEKLASAYPSPRFYADPVQMKRATELGSSFNIIDSDRGEKADLSPLTMDPRYEPAFENRVRQTVDLPNLPDYSVWVARPEDVIIGKLMAWHEGRSQRHMADIFEMLLFSHLGGHDTGTTIDQAYIDRRAQERKWVKKCLICGSLSRLLLRKKLIVIEGRKLGDPSAKDGKSPSLRPTHDPN